MLRGGDDLEVAACLSRSEGKFSLFLMRLGSKYHRREIRDEHCIDF